jgi:hypothetical protein
VDRGFEENQLATVKGLQGYTHATLNVWDDSHDKLIALCGHSISPNYRTKNINSVNCIKCMRKLPSVRSGIREGQK